MVKRSLANDAESPLNPDKSASLLRAGLDLLTFGFAIFDRSLKLVASNTAFRTLRGYPAALCKPGTGIVEFYRFNAERGDYGPGDPEEQARSRVDRIRRRQPHELEYKLASGQILDVRYTPIAHGGMVLAYADITARKRAEEDAARRRPNSTSPSTTCRAPSPTPTMT